MTNSQFCDPIQPELAEPKVSILLVDDNPRNLLALEAILSSLDQNFVRASSGEEALRCLLQEDFALILLDVKMPGIDGFETARLIRERLRSSQIPIIFLTAYSGNETQMFKGYSLGAVDYLVKPIEPAILLSKVTVFVELFKKTAQLQRQAEAISQLNADLEQRVMERTFQLARLTAILTQTNLTLEKRNQELDRFAYVTSHDLKAPLRAIANISHWLEEDLQGKLTDETRHQLDLLRGRIYRMENLINGLLQYSRIGRQEMKSEIVDVNTLLQQAITFLDPPPAFAIEIASEMPKLNTVSVLLEQVFTNLINNAIKHHHRPCGQITISVQKKDDFYEFAVSDDGPGIAPQHQERVFALFQTLRSQDHTEDMGIGLAIVKKIVESEQGTISIESQEGEGTTVRFTWPA